MTVSNKSALHVSQPLDNQKLHVFADGSFEPVSRQGGWAFVAYRGSAEIAFDGGGMVNSTNNAMEAIAMLKAIIWINRNAPEETSTIWSDSIYVVTGCENWLPIWRQNGWKKIDPNPNARRRTISDIELWKVIDVELRRNHRINIAWCKGHFGISGNERADLLADQARTLQMCTERKQQQQQTRSS